MIWLITWIAELYHVSPFVIEPDCDVTKPETPKALEAALESGISVTLVKDQKIEMKEKLSIPSDVKVTLPLEENATIVLDVIGSSSEGEKREYAIDNYGNLTIIGGTIESRGIYNRANATLTIKNLKIVATDSDGGSAINVKGGNVVLENVILEATTGSKAVVEGDINYEPSCTKVENGTLVANNCTFKTEFSGAYAVQALNNGEITLNVCTISAFRGAVYSIGKVTVEGGSYTTLGNSAHVFCAEESGTITAEEAEISAAGSKSSGQVTIN